MALQLKDAFTARALGIAWNNYKQSLGLPPYLGRSFFGTDKKEGLDLRFIKGSKGLPVALKASNFDAQAPLRDGIGFSDIQNEMPFYRESYMVTEKEEQDYASYQEGNPDMANQVLREIMKSPLDLIYGAMVVPERMIWQLLAPADGVPKISVKIDGKDTYYVDYTADNGAAYKTTHYFENISSADKWSAKNTATPIQDILDVQEQHNDNTGEVLSTFVMNSKTWKMFCNAEDTRKQILGVTAYNEGMRLTANDVKAYMLDMYNITILVYNQMFKEADGTSSTFIPDGVVTGIAGNVNQLGTTWFGTTPEERSANKLNGEFTLTETGIAVYTYLTNHPVNTHCVVSEIVLPSYENMDSVFVMKVA